MLKELLEELDNEEVQGTTSRATQNLTRRIEADLKLIRDTSKPVRPSKEGLRWSKPRQHKESVGFW